ncbi:MAG: CBS domain-containing protein [Cyanobacteria bacterium]|nr:CBS domain-containing protein [Cyanobacteriota bacterium]
MIAQALVNDVMSTPLRSVGVDTPLQEAVQLMSDHHISGLPVLDGDGKLVGELTEQQLMVRESGLDTGPYVMLLDAVIYLRNPLSWDRQVHQVLGSRVADLMGTHPHTIASGTPLTTAAKQLHDNSTQRLFVLDDVSQVVGVLTRGDVVRALADQG